MCAARWGVTEWRNQSVSDLEVRQGWLGRRGRQPDADPPEGHPDAFDSRDYGAKALGVLAGSADLESTGADEGERHAA